MSFAIVLSGDVSFTKMVSGEFFKTKFGYPFNLSPVSSLSTFKNSNLLLPEDVRYLILGCLPAMLVELKLSKVEVREVSLSKYDYDDTSNDTFGKIKTFFLYGQSV